jgi:hypothetical protein
MKKWIVKVHLLFILLLCTSCGRNRTLLSSAETSLTLDKSLVYINASISQYDGFQPWKRSPSVDSLCFGTAVGPYQILTTAEPLANASLIQVKIHSSGQFIPATIKVIDYDLNLCLLEIPADSIPSPLVPVTFTEEFIKGTELKGNWLSSDGTVKTARGFLDRAMVMPCPTTYQRTLNFVVSNASRQTSRGEVYTINRKAIGIACSSSEQDVFLIPGETILRFLKQINVSEYYGYGTPGFETFDLLDPTVRKYLKMPEDMKNGNYVSYLYSDGTGSQLLQIGDVLLAVDGISINEFGRYNHPLYESISFEHLIQKHAVGEPVTFTVWRNGQKIDLQTESSRFDSSDMLVPYQEYDKQPEYLVLGGYVFQKLTRDYLRLWGDNWPGKVPPHLFHYYRDLSLKTDEKRKDVVLLSFVLPSTINIGYQNLGRIVVKTVNGMEINKMSDLPEALKIHSESPFHSIEFEQDYPTLVIPKDNLDQIDQSIFQLYGIQKSSNIY